MSLNQFKWLRSVLLETHTKVFVTDFQAKFQINFLSMSLGFGCCVICGNKNCLEAYDHVRTDIRSLQRILQMGRVATKQTNELISRVQNHYHKLTQTFLRILKQDESNIVQSLRRLEYVYLEDKRLPMKLLSEISSGNYDSLPSKNLLPLIDELMKPRVLTEVESEQSEIQEMVEQFMKPQSFTEQLDKAKKILLYPKVQKQFDSRAKLMKKVSKRRIQNPEQCEKLENFTFNIKGMPIKATTRQMQLSNRNITDADILQHINEVRQFHSLTGIELRHNKITQLSCKLIASNLTGLLKVDIRGNRVGDSGVIVIARNLKTLREFYICETGATDRAIEVIVNSLKNMTLLWTESNQVTMEGASLIILQENLKAIGLLGNPISAEDVTTLKKKYTRGYLSI